MIGVARLAAGGNAAALAGLALPATGLGWAGRAADALTSGSNITSWPGLNATGTAAIVGVPTVSGGAIVVGAGKYFTLPAPLSSAGAWTVYGVGTRTSVKDWVLFSSDLLSTQATIFHDGLVGAVDDAGNLRYDTADPTGRMLFRMRRDASNVLKYRVTGGNETTCGTGVAVTGTFTWRTILGDAAASRPTDATTLTEFVALYNSADTVTAGTDPAIVAYLSALYGVTF